MNIIFEIGGGIGKSVMGTAVVSVIRKKYPKAQIIVVTAYPEVFDGNPECRAMGFGTRFFYKDYVNADTKIFKLEPYSAEAHIKGEQHLLKTWCELFGLKYNGEMPKIYLTDFEIQRARSVKKKKPLLIIHPFGGFNQNIKYSWNRDIPVEQAKKIVDKYKDQYDIVQIGREDQITVAQKLTASFRDVASMIAVSDKRIFIDSFCQHIAAALNLPSTVCWITNKPKVFGYAMHKNVLARPFDKKIVPIHSYLEEFTIDGSQLYQYPYNNEEVFNINEI